MTKRAPKNIAVSVHQRLLNIAKESRRPFNEVFQYYAMERFLYRLSMSKHSQDFVLKGALLFRIWDIPDTRATRDIDLLAFTDNTPERLSKIIRDVCDIERPDYWGGYLVRPVSMEFWQGRDNRLHDRIRYSLQADFDWKIERLAP